MLLCVAALDGGSHKLEKQICMIMYQDSRKSNEISDKGYFIYHVFVKDTSKFQLLIHLLSVVPIHIGINPALRDLHSCRV